LFVWSAVALFLLMLFLLLAGVLHHFSMASVQAPPAAGGAAAHKLVLAFPSIKPSDGSECCALTEAQYKAEALAFGKSSEDDFGRPVAKPAGASPEMAFEGVQQQAAEFACSG
jgi:hypothetical protein